MAHQTPLHVGFPRQMILAGCKELDMTEWLTQIQIGHDLKTNKPKNYYFGLLWKPRLNSAGTSIKNGQHTSHTFRCTSSSYWGSWCESWGLWKKEMTWKLKEILQQIILLNKQSFLLFLILKIIINLFIWLHWVSVVAWGIPPPFFFFVASELLAAVCAL